MILRIGMVIRDERDEPYMITLVSDKYVRLVPVNSLGWIIISKLSIYESLIKNHYGR